MLNAVISLYLLDVNHILCHYNRKSEIPLDVMDNMYRVSSFSLNAQTFHLLADAMPYKVLLGDAYGMVFSHNKQWSDYMSYPLEGLQGWQWRELVHPEDWKVHEEKVHFALTTGEPIHFEERLLRKDGHYRWHQSSWMAQQTTDGSTLLWVCTSIDIDDQKQAELQLKKREENFHIVAEAIPQLVWIARPDGFVEYHNQRFCDYTGLSPEQLEGDKWLNILHPDDVERTKSLWQNALQVGESYENKVRFRIGEKGAYNWFLVQALPLKDDSSQIIKWVGACTNIDSQKQIEQMLIAREENFRVLAEAVPQLVWIARPDGYNEFHNQRWCDYANASPEQLRGNKWMQFMHPDDKEPIMLLWNRALEMGTPYQGEVRLRNGRTGAYRWFLTRALPAWDEHGQLFKWFGTCTDIDDQKCTELALRQSQERIRALMDSPIIGIIETEGEHIIEANDTFLKMTGYCRADLYNKRMNWRVMTPLEYAPLDQNASHELATHHLATPYEKEYICQDGRRLPVVLGIVQLPPDFLQSIAFVLDNSARKELEQRKDDFMSMASHELRTPLTVLKVQMAILNKYAARHNIPERYIQSKKLEEQVDRLTKLVEALLDGSKINTGRLDFALEVVDLGELLADLAESMQQVNSTHRIHVHCPLQTHVFGDPDRLRQVFMNLMSNAVKYSPQSDIVEVNAVILENQVRVSICDYGIGISLDQQNRIFDRFYRTHLAQSKVFPGLGMGLYISSEIIKLHGGTITVQSEPGQGSTFSVTLPLKKPPESMREEGRLS